MSCREQIIKVRQEIAYLFLMIERTLTTFSQNIDETAKDTLRKKFIVGMKWLGYMESLVKLEYKNISLGSSLLRASNNIKRAKKRKQVKFCIFHHFSSNFFPFLLVLMSFKLVLCL